ncbi:MAG TPA: hypothetical protein VIH99_08190, partial [Bdellovibrionota bacterium]
MGLCFALQTLAAAPLHPFHGNHHFRASFAHGQESGDETPNLPHSCRCDLCLNFSALDSDSVAKPPEFSLVETAFS